MNAPVKLEADPMDALRYYKSIRAANIMRMAKCAADWADCPDSEYWRLRFMDALSFCIDSDLSQEMDDLRHDLGIDEEGYPLTDEGDTDYSADRRYVPMQASLPCKKGRG